MLSAKNRLDFELFSQSKHPENHEKDQMVTRGKKGSDSFYIEFPFCIDYLREQIERI